MPLVSFIVPARDEAPLIVGTVAAVRRAATELAVAYEIIVVNDGSSDGTAALAETGYFNPAEVNRLREQHRVGKSDHSRLLMGVLTTQLWHGEFMRDRI